MTFYDKSRCDMLFQQVINKGKESEMNYIKIFQNEQVLSVLVRNSYSGDQMMHISLNNFHQGGKYTAQIVRKQAKLRREEIFTDQKYLSVSSLLINYLNLDRGLGLSRNNEIANPVQTKCTLCGGTNHSINIYC